MLPVLPGSQPIGVLAIYKFKVEMISPLHRAPSLIKEDPLVGVGTNV